MIFEIVYRDETFLAVNKPNGILVHRTPMAKDETVFVLQLLRNQTGLHLYPVHRLDRPTSGVLLFALSSEVARNLNEQLTSHTAEKTYLALVRGWMLESVDLDYPVKNEKGNIYNAHTLFQPVEKYELPIPMGKYPAARYSLVEARPLSGRWHQIRQHLAHLRHYIVNDRVHGDGKHNRMFTEQLELREMFLHAHKISLLHPRTNERITIEAQLPEHWKDFEEICVELASRSAFWTSLDKL